LKSEKTNRVISSVPPGWNFIVYPLLFIAFVILMVLLRLLKSILIPFALAIFLAYVLYPLANALTRLKIPYGLAVLIVMLLFLGLFLGAGLIIGSEISGFVQAIPQYQAALKQYLSDLFSLYRSLIEKAATILPGEPLSERASGHSASLISGIIGNLFNGLMSVFSLVSDFIMIFFILIFLLAGARNFKKKLNKAWGERGEGEERRAAEIVESVNEGIGGYIIIRSLINLGLAIVVTAVLLIFNIEYAYIWGPLTGLLNFIPYIGAFLAVIPPIIVALFHYESYWTAIVLLALIVAIQNLEGNVITPYLVGRRVNLNPLAVLLSLILWGFIWGPVGMILATPLTTCFKILCDQIEPLRPIGILLGSGGKSG
jgi:AI-2 transport protein TqsA